EQVALGLEVLDLGLAIVHLLLERLALVFHGLLEVLGLHHVTEYASWITDADLGALLRVCRSGGKSDRDGGEHRNEATDGHGKVLSICSLLFVLGYFLAIMRV